MSQYPVTNYATPTAALNAIFTDMGWTCPTKLFADALVNIGVPVYMYSFQDPCSFAANPCYGASLSFELPFLYPALLPGFVSEFGGTTLTAGEAALSIYMREVWATFGASGSPNPPHEFTWPHYNSTVSPYVILTPPVTTLNTATHYGNGKCVFWDTVNCLPNLPGGGCTFQAETTAYSSGSGDGDGLDGGQIAGIVIGSVFGFFLIVLIIVVVGVVLFIAGRKTARPPEYKLMERDL